MKQPLVDNVYLFPGFDLAYRGVQKGKIPELKKVTEVVAEETLLRQKVSAPIKFGEAGSIDVRRDGVKL